MNLSFKPDRKITDSFTEDEPPNQECTNTDSTRQIDQETSYHKVKVRAESIDETSCIICGEVNDKMWLGCLRHHLCQQCKNDYVLLDPASSNGSPRACLFCTQDKELPKAVKSEM